MTKQTTLEGWQLVPVEPTIEMVIAGGIELGNPKTNMPAIYRAMLAAAPRTEPCGGWPSEEEIMRAVYEAECEHYGYGQQIKDRDFLSHLPRMVLIARAIRSLPRPPSEGTDVVQLQRPGALRIINRLEREGHLTIEDHTLLTTVIAPNYTFGEIAKISGESVSHSTMLPGNLPSEIK